MKPKDHLSGKSILFFIATFIFSALLFSALTNVAGALEAAAKANAFSASSSAGAIRMVIPAKLRIFLLGVIAAAGLTFVYSAFETIFESANTRTLNKVVVEEMLTIRFRIMYFALAFSIMVAGKIWWGIVGKWQLIHSYGALAIWSWALTLVVSLILAFCLTSLSWFFFGDFIHNTTNNAVINKDPNLAKFGDPSTGVPNINEL